MRKTFYLIIGMLVGAVVGVVAAILLAPYSGGELQRRMRDQLDQVRARLQQIVEEGRQAAAVRTREVWGEFEAAKRGETLSPGTEPEQLQA